MTIDGGTGQAVAGGGAGANGGSVAAGGATVVGAGGVAGAAEDDIEADVDIAVVGHFCAALPAVMADIAIISFINGVELVLAGGGAAGAVGRIERGGQFSTDNRRMAVTAGAIGFEAGIVLMTLDTVSFVEVVGGYLLVSGVLFDAVSLSDIVGMAGFADPVGAAAGRKAVISQVAGGVFDAEQTDVGTDGAARHGAAVGEADGGFHALDIAVDRGFFMAGGAQDAAGITGVSAPVTAVFGGAGEAVAVVQHGVVSPGDEIDNDSLGGRADSSNGTAVGGIIVNHADVVVLPGDKTA